MLTACALLLLVFQLGQDMSAKRRLLSPHELNLRRATQPLGFVAILAWFFTRPGARRATDLSFVFQDPGAYWLPLTLFGVVLLYGFATVITGVTRCWGVRSDGMLPMRAFIECAFGVGGFVLVREPLANIYQFPGRGALIDLGKWHRSVTRLGDCHANYGVVRDSRNLALGPPDDRRRKSAEKDQTAYPGHATHDASCAPAVLVAILVR